MLTTKSKNTTEAFVITPCFVSGAAKKFGDVVKGIDAAYLIQSRSAVNNKDEEAVKRAKAIHASKKKDAKPAASNAKSSK